MRVLNFLSIPRPALGRGLFVAVAVLALLGSRPAIAKPKKGEILVFQGLVTDHRGEPLEGVRVVFEAANRKRMIGSSAKTTRGMVRQATLSAADGSYAFEWEWLGYYNSFRLRAVDGTGSAVATERYVTLESVDVSKQATSANPVNASLIIDDGEFVYEHRAFMAEWQSEDERLVYADLGKPDRVDRNREAEDEATWWFFERGKVYRFNSGTLTSVEDFVPVEPF